MSQKSNHIAKIKELDRKKYGIMPPFGGNRVKSIPVSYDGKFVNPKKKVKL